MNFSFSLKDHQQLALHYEEAKKDKRFCELVKKLGFTEEEAMKKTSKLQDIVKELEHCQSCKGIYDCQNAYKGHYLFAKKEEDDLVFTYVPCKYKKMEVVHRKEKLSEEQVNQKARMKDIDVTDKKRVEVIKWLDQFYETYDFSKVMKGLYLSGNFGCGKTFLVSALLHELEEKKNVLVSVVYFPEIIRELKADWEMYDARMKMYQTVDILCIDDIGAEKVSEWSRDEVLGTLLQSRMNANLTTFFTSNLTLDELENHFQMNHSSEEKIKSRRIMERIRQLTIPMSLISENRRK